MFESRRNHQFPSSLEELVQQRREAEQTGDDKRLYALRVLEMAHLHLPSRVDDIQLTDLLWADNISTVWLGWRDTDGKQCLLRCIRKEWKTDPVMLRRLKRARDLFQESTPHVALPIWREHGDWIYLLYLLDEGQLAFQAAERWDELDWSVVILGALKGLTIIHRTSISLGVDIQKSLLIKNSRSRLLWLDPFPAAFTPLEDLRNLALWVSSHGPWHLDSVPALVAEWAISTPLSSSDGLRLAQRALGERLGDFAYGLRQEGQKLHKQLQSLRLWQASHDLQTPPPVINLSLHSGKQVYTKDSHLFLKCPLQGEQLVFSPSSGLNIAFGRVLRNDCLRSIAQRDEASSASNSIQQLRRWLQSTMQLRRLNGLLRFQLQKLHAVGTAK